MLLALNFRFSSTSSFLAAAIAMGLLASGCSSTKGKPDGRACQERFGEIQTKIDKEKWTGAREKLQLFTVDCSGTEHSEKAMYFMGVVNERLEDWAAAEEEYAIFLRQYPHSKTFGAEVEFAYARALARQSPIPSRDPSKTLEAIAEFEAFMASHPDSPFADSAKTERDQLRQKLADRDMAIARLYRRMGEPLAAVVYYKNLLKEMGDRVPEREINLKMVECYVSLRQFGEAEEILARFDGMANSDPLRPEVLKAHHLLDKERAEADKEKREEERESKGS